MSGETIINLIVTSTLPMSAKIGMVAALLAGMGFFGIKFKNKKIQTAYNLLTNNVNKVVDIVESTVVSRLKSNNLDTFGTDGVKLTKEQQEYVLNIAKNMIRDSTGNKALSLLKKSTPNIDKVIIDLIEKQILESKIKQQTIDKTEGVGYEQ